jgi:NitT/TauT family transport system substrate-binding protein
MAVNSGRGTAATFLGRRRLLLQATAAGVAAVALRPGAARSQGTGTGGLVRWVSPRGTVEVLDDYPYWVARRFGYFGDLETTLEPGPMRADATVQLVDQLQADMGYPAPALLARSLEAGSPLVSVWQMGAYDIFGFAFRAGTKPPTPQGLAGRRILLGSLAWQPVADLELAQLGLAPGAVTYLEAGARWGEVLARGEGDAALCWEGLRAQWQGQGLAFDYLTPPEFSRLPSGSFVIRRAELSDPSRFLVLDRYLRAWAMGLQFGHLNPAAAAQVVLEQFPALAGYLRSEVAVEAVTQLSRTYRGPWEQRQGWGWHDPGQWQFLLDLMQRHGQLARRISAEDAITNGFVHGANAFDYARVAGDAAGFALAPEFGG